jgi:enterochelin esterase-like enzyme
MQLTTHLQPWPIAMRIYMPPCYDPQRAGGYPLLILLHGQGYTFDQWDRDGIVAAADRLITAGEIAPLVIVMPNEFDSLSDPAGSHFDQVIAEAVLPWVEEHYQTCAKRECRAIGGISRGATWAVHIGFQRPDLFAAVGAHSFTPFIGDVYRLKYWLNSIAPAAPPRFYLDMGAADQPLHLEAIDQFREEMTNFGVGYEWHLNAGGYDDAYWSAHAEEYLRWYGEEWK